MSCETPTVVKGPDYWNFCLFQICKQLFYLQVKTMYIVEMNNIRLFFLNFLNQFVSDSAYPNGGYLSLTLNDVLSGTYGGNGKAPLT